MFALSQFSMRLSPHPQSSLFKLNRVEAFSQDIELCAETLSDPLQREILTDFVRRRCSRARASRRPNAVVAAVSSNGEYRRDVIEVERLFGRMLGMLHLGGRYGKSHRHVRYAPWRLRRPEEYLRRPREAHV